MKLIKLCREDLIILTICIKQQQQQRKTAQLSNNYTLRSCAKQRELLPRQQGASAGAGTYVGATAGRRLRGVLTAIHRLQPQLHLEQKHTPHVTSREGKCKQKSRPVRFRRHKAPAGQHCLTEPWSQPRARRAVLEMVLPNLKCSLFGKRFKPTLTGRALFYFPTSISFT